MAMFQGVVALPAAFALERRIGWGRMAAGNPLRDPSVKLAVSQALALPLMIIVFNLNAGGIPLVMAGLGGVHFFPYAWLHRSQLYTNLAIVVAVGAFGLQLLFGATAFHLNLFLIAGAYLLTSPA